MAILCTHCGRQYDATLFQFGRTINCTCGERVGFEHRLNLPRGGTSGAEIKFFADVNAARVVRWLRAIGIDTAWEDAIPDADLVRRAIGERRFVLTLDKRLVREFRADNVFLLSSEKPLEQFREIVAHFDIRNPGELFTRCLICNTPLRSIAAAAAEIDEHVGAAAAAAAMLPPHIRENYDVFYLCPNCGRVYWEGSHTRRMRAAIEEVFKRQPD